MSSKAEVRKIMRYVATTSLPHTCEDASSAAREDASSTALEKSAGDDWDERFSQEDGDLNNARRHSCVLFSESPASSGAGSPGGNNAVSPSPVALKVRAPGASGTAVDSPSLTTPEVSDERNKESLSPAYTTPPSPILVLSASTSPDRTHSRLQSYAGEQRSSQRPLLPNITCLKAGSAEEPSIFNCTVAGNSSMELSFDLPTPTYISSSTSNTSSLSSSQDVGNDDGKTSHVFKSRSSSSDDLMFCGVSHTQVLPETCRNIRDMELVDQRDASLSMLNSANNTELGGEWQDALPVEIPEEVAVEEEAMEEEEAEEAQIKRDLEVEDKRTSGLYSAPVPTAEEEELLYVNDQFDPDWMMDVTDYGAASSLSQPLPVNLSTPKPSPPAAAAAVGASLSSLTQAPRNTKHPVATPMSGGWSIVSNDNITPMPQYYNMTTSNLKKEGQKFGLRGLPKRKLLTKLVEIYNYTHPLIGEHQQGSQS